MAYGVAEIRRIHVCPMGPAIGGYQAITSRLISIARIYLIKNDCEFRCLHDLPWRACAWNTERSTAECRIRMNPVRS